MVTNIFGGEMVKNIFRGEMVKNIFGGEMVKKNFGGRDGLFDVIQYVCYRLYIYDKWLYRHFFDSNYIYTWHVLGPT